jgi:hypothetical protein
MFFEYFRIYAIGEALSPIDLMSRVLFIALFALALTILGNRIKRHLGEFFALAYGAVIFLVNQEALRY